MKLLKQMFCKHRYEAMSSFTNTVGPESPLWDARYPYAKAVEILNGRCAKCGKWVYVADYR